MVYRWSNGYVWPRRRTNDHRWPPSGLNWCSWVWGKHWTPWVDRVNRRLIMIAHSDGVNRDCAIDLDIFSLFQPHSEFEITQMRVVDGNVEWGRVRSDWNIKVLPTLDRKAATFLLIGPLAVHHCVPYNAALFRPDAQMQGDVIARVYQWAILEVNNEPVLVKIIKLISLI